jgi:c(7)-type cytochrome triheme protein
MSRIVMFIAALLCLAGLSFAAGGTRQKQVKPYEYGTVTINNFSAAAGLGPVTFDHWVHRSRFTCRLCHVDLGFTMKAGASEIKAADNMRGYFCGACHNGTLKVEGRTVFRACLKNPTAEEAKQCSRCHSKEKNLERVEAFHLFAAKMPRERLGNGINWERAEQEGLVKPIDFLPGISMKRSPMAIQKDFSLEAKVQGLPEIIFSHKKHTVWNGCEVCHPEVFAGVKRGSTKYTMLDLIDGKFCGICHKSVAFPLQDCQRCHSKPVS